MDLMMTFSRIYVMYFDPISTPFPFPADAFPRLSEPPSTFTPLLLLTQCVSRLQGHE